MKDYILRPDTITKDRVKELGGKAESLYRLSETGLNIPKWFAVSYRAFSDHLSEQNAEEHDLREYKMDTKLKKQIEQEVDLLGGEYFAVRSSSQSEDAGEHSYAGQFETFLWISKVEIIEYIVKVWQSGMSERVKVYQQNTGEDILLEIPTVIVQRMVNSEKSGVAFAVDPVTGAEDKTVISAVFGLGSALVDGSANADVYKIDRRKNHVIPKIAEKNITHLIRDGKIVQEAVDSETKDKAVLTDVEIKEITKLVHRTSNHFGRYQDIEWAIEHDELYLLQSRPITTLNKTIQQNGQIMIFDSSNIAESYGHVTKPLTESFIRYVYQEVYKQFCKLFGISGKVIQSNEEMFARMLGFKNGRVYYNLLSWYQMLALMPFYKTMSGLMEKMMGVEESLPEEFRTSVIPPSENVIRQVYQNSRTVNHFLHELIHLDRNVEAFQDKITQILSEKDPSVMSLDELASYYNELKAQLIAEWGIPLANDFFTMVFHGTLQNLCVKWCSKPDIHNDLLSGQGGIVSAEPVKLVRNMASYIRKEPQLVELFLNGSRAEIEDAVKNDKKLHDLLDEYMNRFSDRCMDELKLESDTLLDNPLLLYRSIGAMARKDNTAWNETDDLVKNARAEVRKDMRYHPLRYGIFTVTERQAKKMVRNRENLRFERTRVFGKVRRIFVEIGIRFASRGVIEDKRDIFYLTSDEIFGFIDGTTVTYDLKELIRLRKTEYASYEDLNDPPRRFAVHSTFGGSPTEVFTTREERTKDDSVGILKGLACCPGIIEGTARVVLDPTDTAMREGEILVAEHTDPGWITLFSMASALVIEHGSLLSHAAIVSREMGIPTVVSVKDATNRISDGDRIRVDGEKGTIEIIEKGERIE